MAGVYTDGTPMRRLRERQGARMRQRGGAALQGEVTQVDHTGADALTSATIPGATSLGTVTTASSARATSRKITALVGAGATVGVTTEPIRDDYDGRVAYDALGGGEDVLVEALVEVHASATVGVLLVASAVGGVGCFRCLTAESGAVAYARLEEDCTVAGNDQIESIAGLRRRWVQLISRGTPSGEGGASEFELPDGDEGDILTLGPDGESLVAEPPGEVFATVEQGELADTALQPTDYTPAQSLLVAVADETPLPVEHAEGTITGRPSGTDLGAHAATAYLLDMGLDGAVTRDTVAWDIGTEYAPNTEVEHNGRLYFQADSVSSTGDDPESGAPWEFAGYYGADGPAAVVEDIDTELGSDTWQGGGGGGGAADSIATMGGYVSGRYYSLVAPGLTVAVTQMTLLANRALLVPFIPDANITFTSLGIQLVAGVAAANAKILVYSSTSGFPSTQVFASGNIAATTAEDGTFIAVSSGLPALTAGTQYWIGFVSDAAITVRAFSSSSNATRSFGSATADGGAASHLYDAITFASPPSPWTFAASQLASGNCPLVRGLV